MTLDEMRRELKSLGYSPDDAEAWVRVADDAVAAAAREVRAAFDAGKWPLGPSYKAVQDALRKLDAVLPVSPLNP